MGGEERDRHGQVIRGEQVVVIHQECDFPVSGTEAASPGGGQAKFRFDDNRKILQGTGDEKVGCGESG